MRRLLWAGLGLVLALAGGLLALRRYVSHELQDTMLRARPQSAKTPQQYGAPYEELTIQSGPHALKAYYVAPPPLAATAPSAAPRPALTPAGQRVSVLVFHGNDESIASWSPVQGYLYARGLGSMVFDYSGFGHSEGKPRLEDAIADGRAAWSAFKAKLPPGTRACAYGLSLGSGVLLEDAPRLAPAPDCLVVYGAFTSALGAGVRMHALPAWAQRFLPDAMPSVQNAARLPAPLLVIHGDADEKFPLEDSQAIADAAHARLVSLPGFTHAQPLVKPDDAGWKDALAFMLQQP